jgi:hypothetical protein
MPTTILTSRAESGKQKLEQIADDLVGAPR